MNTVKEPCNCDVCKDITNVYNHLAKIEDVELRKFFEDLFISLANTREELDILEAIVANEWPSSEEKMANAGWIRKDIINESRQA